MAGAISLVVVFSFLSLYVCGDEIAKIISARKSKQLEIEKEITEQKRLELEIAKVNAGLVTSSEG